MRIILATIVLLFLSCQDPPFETMALVPEYFDALDFSEIGTLGPQPIIKQGSILQLGNYLFINDINRGIHVVDYTEPGTPYYMYFWNIPGNQTFNINGDYLYADNGPHLLIINIADFENIRYESFVPDVYLLNMSEQFPEDALAGAYFVCPDPSEGLVKEWREELVTNPNCQRR